MAAVSQERTKTGVLRAIRTLASHHLPIVIKKLLAGELPYADHVVDTWHTLASDETLSERILAGRQPPPTSRPVLRAAPHCIFCE
jgi:hypothetical protein